MATFIDYSQPVVPGEARNVDGRVDRPDLLVIGGTGRNSGKTELACRLVGRHAASMPIVGLKVTTVDQTDGHCPHGGEGCGVCSSLTQPWIVSREMNSESGKDTARLLASGAREVYWLRVLRSQLARGTEDLLTRMPSGWLGVCESTSLRQIVEPGLFLLVRAAGRSQSKRSALDVAHLADRVVESDGRSFDLDLDRISVVDGQWALRREACAVVIDGAESRREVGGSVAIRSTLASLESQFDHVVVAPETTEQSTLSEWATRLPEVSEQWCLVTPSLKDGVPPRLVNAMFRRRGEVDAVVVVTESEGRDVRLVLCRRELLPEVIATFGGDTEAVAAFRDRAAGGELRFGATRNIGRER